MKSAERGIVDNSVAIDIAKMKSVASGKNPSKVVRVSAGAEIIINKNNRLSVRKVGAGKGSLNAQAIKMRSCKGKTGDAFKSCANVTPKVPKTAKTAK